MGACPRKVVNLAFTCYNLVVLSLLFSGWFFKSFQNKASCDMNWRRRRFVRFFKLVWHKQDQITGQGPTHFQSGKAVPGKVGKRVDTQSFKWLPKSAFQCSTPVWVPASVTPHFKFWKIIMTSLRSRKWEANGAQTVLDSLIFIYFTSKPCWCKEIVCAECTHCVTWKTRSGQKCQINHYYRLALYCRPAYGAQRFLLKGIFKGAGNTNTGHNFKKIYERMRYLFPALQC